MLIFSQSGFPIGTIPRAGEPCYWALKRSDGVWLCEYDTVSDVLFGGKRQLDWTLDIASTRDWRRIKELWLFCPATPTSPAGNTACLPITTPGTAFQLKVATMDSVISESMRAVQAHIIGRVMDESGACECFIFDYALQGMLAKWTSNIYRFGSWRDGIAPLGALALPVLGINLPVITGGR